MTPTKINLAYYIKLAESDTAKEVLTRDIVQNFKKRKIPEGLYLSERNVFGGGFDDARHVFLTNIYNKKPKFVDAKRLDNGQYATTFSMNSRMVMGLPLGGNYLAINGKSGDMEFNDTDMKVVNDLIANKDTLNMRASLYPITNDKRRRYSLVRKIKNIIEKNKESSLGDYRLFGIPGLVQKNNCVSVAGALMSQAGIKAEDLPEQLGGIGGISRDEIYDYMALIPKNKNKNTKTAGIISNYILPESDKKKKNKTSSGILGFLSGKTPEEQLKEELEQQAIEENPELYNKLNEEDRYPKVNSRGNAISALGAGAGLVYGLGSGYSQSKKDPHFGTPQIIASGLGYGALGFGLLTAKDVIARGVGGIIGKHAPARTKKEQQAYDSKKQIFSRIPGFDAYNAEMRKRVKEEDQEDIDNNQKY